MVYKFQNDRNTDSKWLLTKTRQKYVNEKELKTLSLQKLYQNAVYWRLEKMK